MKFRLKVLFFGLTSFLIIIPSCRKENSLQKIDNPPFLTGRVWILDTILVTPPDTYDGLNDNEKISYNTALGWLKSAELTFNNDGSAVSGGDYDFGYNGWRLINNESDIEVTLASSKDTLRSWTADNLHFTFIHAIGHPFNCTFIFK